MTPKEIFIRAVLLPLIIITFHILNIVKHVVLFILSIVSTSVVPPVVRTPEERFDGLDTLGYTFAPHYVDLPIGGKKTLPRLHYVDEGPRDSRETILCLHGVPSWSFLYRKMIPVFVAAGYRVIAPDFIGFGKSDKFTNPNDYSMALHTMTLRLFLDHLKLTDVTMVCQDWGGITGLPVIKDSPHFFSRVVIMNTGLPTGETIDLHRFFMLTPFATWRAGVRLFQTYLPIGKVFALAMTYASNDVLAAYCAPFPSPLYQAGAARWPLLVPLTKDSVVAVDTREAKEFLKNKWNRPSLIMFSDDDPITGQEEKDFQEMLPRAKNVTVAGGGHFLQELNGKLLAENVIRFINESE